jgi:hypothetical protein
MIYENLLCPLGVIGENYRDFAFQGHRVLVSLAEQESMEDNYEANSYGFIQPFVYCNKPTLPEHCRVIARIVLPACRWFSSP